MVLYFPGPASATGEDVLELHVHGGPAIVKAVLSAIPLSLNEPGAIRPAEPGEFTRRAFMNDRLDLVQVEALGDSLSAVTERQRRIAVRGTTSHLGRVYEGWRQQLLAARAELEALIDFSEDQHFSESPAELIGNAAQQVDTLHAAVMQHVRNAMRGELLRSGIAVSLLGAPNAGKSSLLNRMVGREAAIVSTEAGTTRDVVEVSVDIGGFLCRFGDTAGLRTPTGLVEREGIRRAKALAAESDLVIVLLSFDTDGSLSIDEEVRSALSELVQSDTKVVICVNKLDQASTLSLSATTAHIRSMLPDLPPDTIVQYISCLPSFPNDGIQSLLSVLTDEFSALTSPESSALEQDEADSLSATPRQQSLLSECATHLEHFLVRARPGSSSGLAPSSRMVDGDGETDEGDVDFVLAAEHLRAAAGCLARITGRGTGEAGDDVEEVLGVVFAKFCVGK
ncbi:hypothetical protein ANO11243_071810 [Dothideomycetidae sp. 11243]|nr:hypothetical protein ANO11243_071810 [fungal sp. No.11243]